MRAQGKLASSAILAGNVTSVILDIYGDHVAELGALRDKPLAVEIKPHRQRRSLDANALCWALCSQIGQALSPPLAREEVYRRAIRAVGPCEHLLIREDALEDFARAYGCNGIGWFVLKVGDAPLRGYCEALAYQGSSSYDTKAMSVLIDYLVDEAEQMELPIAIERREIEKIKEQWRKIQDE